MGGAFLKVDIAYESSLVTLRSHNRVMRLVMLGMITRHLEKDLPKHFERSPETAANGQYGYAPRSQKYLNRKLRVTGQNAPLVFSGRMRNTVLHQSRLTATKDRARLYVRNYFPMIEQRRKEVEAITPSETESLLAFGRREYLRLIKTDEFRRQRAPQKIT